MDADLVVFGASRDLDRLAAEAERARPDVHALDSKWLTSSTGREGKCATRSALDLR